MTATQLVRPTRRIALDGPVNFRDLGGYRGAQGRSVRWRRVFRADTLDSMTERDVEVIVAELGVRTIIDLRTEREVERHGVGPIAANGDVVWRHVSIIDETQTVWQDAMDGGSVTDQYFAMLEGSSTKFIQALAILAETDGPVVFHCAAGKDRTGLVAALLLSVLGVSDREITHDYGLTAEVMPQLRRRWEARASDPRFAADDVQRPGWREAIRKAMTADPDTLASVLESLTCQHGSAGAWLHARGLAPDVAESLRRSLLV